LDLKRKVLSSVRFAEILEELYLEREVRENEEIFSDGMGDFIIFEHGLL